MDDPHASLIDPKDARLFLRPQRGRRLKRGPVIFVMAAVSLVMGMALMGALMSPEALAQFGDDEPANLASVRAPDSIKNAPSFAQPVNMKYSIQEARAGGKGYVDRQSEEAQQQLRAQGGLAQTSHAFDPSNPSYGEMRAMGEGATYNTLSGQGRRGVNGHSGGYAQMNGPTREDKSFEDEEAAKKAGLFFPGSKGGLDPRRIQADQRTDKLIGAYEKQLNSLGRMTKGGGDGHGFSLGANDPNFQSQKKAFMQEEGASNKSYVEASLERPRSPYEVKAGAVVPISLITGINSDIPGEIIGQVRENVYDTVSGNHLLIPQGTRVMAQYDSMISYGQDRVMVCWNRLIRPDGTSLTLGCAPGVSLSGYSGFEDEVDNHYMRLAGGVVLSSILAATAATSQGTDLDNGATSFDQMFAANAGSEINNVGQRITRKNLSVQPTIKIRPGFSVNMLVNKDLILSPYKRKF